MLAKPAGLVIYRIYFFILRCRAKFLNVMNILYGLTSTSRTGSVYVTIAVTIERYFAIVKPTNQFKMRVILLPIAITFAILYNFPKVCLKGDYTDWIKFKLFNLNFCDSFLKWRPGIAMMGLLVKILQNYAKQVLEWMHTTKQFMFSGVKSYSWSWFPMLLSLVSMVALSPAF